jgi:hypothetical protein
MSNPVDQGWGCSLLVAHLLCMSKALDSIPSISKVKRKQERKKWSKGIHDDYQY